MTADNERRTALPVESDSAALTPAASSPLTNSVTRPIAALVAAAGFLALVGWAFDIEPLKRLLPRLGSMKANAALCFILAGISLWLSGGGKNWRGAGGLQKALAMTIVAIGLATLVEYVSGLNLRIDQLLVADPETMRAHPGRMAPELALVFVLLGSSLIAIDARSRATQIARDIAALAAGFIGQVSLIEYLFQAFQHDHVISFTAMALHASIATIALTVGIILAGAENPLSRMLLTSGVVGILTRRLLVVTVTVLVLTGMFGFFGRELGFFEWQSGLAIVVVGSVTAITSVVYRSGYMLKRYELAEAQALRSAKSLADQYARLVANVPGGVYTRQMDAEGRITFSFLSPRYGEIIGVDPAKAVNDPSLVLDRLHPDDRSEVLASLNESGKDLSSWQREFRIVLPTGEVRWIRSQANPYRTAAGEVAWDGIVFDITDSKTRDDQLRQGQKLEAIGQLTGGVAHDFNNLLTVILGNAETLTGALAGDPKLKRLAEMVDAAAQRGADLTASLLAFSRKQPLEPKSTDINGLVTRIHGMLRRALGEHIEIEFLPGGGLWPATVDPAQLETAILNLAVNARDAMPEGGKLTVETANVELDRDYVRRNEGVSPGAYVMIGVTDSGTGMTPEVQTRAFEPFFTTKEVGRGTGLGLSMVFGLVKQSNGHINIYSEVGHGTTVKLYLPRSAAEDETSVVPSELPEPRGDNEIILIAEDDDMIRVYVEGQIGSLGYRVLTARNGREAVEVLLRGEPVDLLFTDVVMPGGMNGSELAKEARRLRPGLKVLFTSGYTENAIVHQGKLDPGIDLLKKPYRRHDLAVMLRAVLDRPQPAP